MKQLLSDDVITHLLTTDRCVLVAPVETERFVGAFVLGVDAQIAGRVTHLQTTWPGYAPVSNNTPA